MKAMMQHEWDDYRFEGSIIDLHRAFSDKTELEDIQPGEWAFISTYIENIVKLQRINSRQVAAMILVTLESDVCTLRAIGAIL